MKKNSIALLLLLLCRMAYMPLSAQENENKVTLNGSARAVMFNDHLSEDTAVPDTITAPKQNSGHTLVDLGINIRPNKNIEIQGMVRIRNDFGGFWGSGITFDERQLFVKGVIANTVRYQLGDINYKLTPYTFINNDVLISKYIPAQFHQFSSEIDYDNFYDNDHTWRQQGVATDFALVFKKYLEELDFNGFTSRIHTSGAGENERLFSGVNITLVQSRYLSLGWNYVNLYDIAGTSNNPATYHNPVNTATAAINYNFGKWEFTAGGEAGISKSFYDSLSAAPSLSDYFADGTVQVKFIPAHIYLGINYKSVGPDFRSPGAQTQRLNFSGFPRAYDRITNDQMLRPISMLDIFRDAALYNLQLQSNLMAYDPKYDNITPYGTATPNRQGTSLNAGFSDNKQIVEVTAGYHMLTEIRGQGTFNLREFNRMEANATLHADKLISNYKKLLRVQVSFNSDNTTRTGQDGVAPVDLQSTIVSAGIEAETAARLDVLAGWQTVSYSGFEFLPDVDLYGNIIYFNEYAVDGNEQLTGAGLRYRFTNDIYLTGMYNHFTWENSATEIPSYSINEFAFIFKMNF